MKTKNFYWYMSGPHFRDYHLPLDEHGDQISAMTDPLAETGPQDRRRDAAIHRPYRPPAAHPRQ